ncbi:universal stress protein [Mycolicibacterium lacusdiani]|uniref:universal stress protein n=1 Tax=Mycolicibacterium lacusdiani TaxID=2895283 RepID=UPI001F388788|nr:universal stress protein [Mycolicibacterium lacusdiani]
MSNTSTRPGIVVGVDGSPGSVVALRWAARNAEMRNLPLTLVHVCHGHREHGQRILSEARQVVADACPGGSVRVHREMPIAHAVSALVDQSKNATLVVVGCLGTGTLRGRRLGSVSSGLTHYAHCPVAVIHDGIGLDLDSTAPVVVGIDDSSASQSAAAIAFDEASHRKVELVALRAWKDVSPFDSAVSFSGKGWRALHAKEEESMALQLAPWIDRYPDVPVRRVIVRDNDAARRLIDQSRSAQLIVVGSHGSGGFAGMLLGSVSAAVVLLSRVPVIVARQR